MDTRKQKQQTSATHVSENGLSRLQHGAPTGLTDYVVIEIRFETGDSSFKGLETATFVGAGRFRVEDGKPMTVEYQVSRVVKGS